MVTMEKRKAKRIIEENKVTITPIYKDELPSGEKIIYPLTKDISSGGVKILTNTFLPINTFLRIELSLKNAPRLIIAIGEVRWAKKRYAEELFETGIEFIDMSPGSNNILKKHIDELEA